MGRVAALNGTEFSLIASGSRRGLSHKVSSATFREHSLEFLTPSNVWLGNTTLCKSGYPRPRVLAVPGPATE